MIPVFVISLERSLDRRKRIAADLAALRVPFAFINALGGDGRERYSRRYNRPLAPGEIGCYRSHIASAQAVATSGVEFACVLEDDAVLKPSALAFLEAARLAALPPFDILRLQENFHGRRKHIATVGDINVCAPLYPDGGSAAQIYSRAGAAKIANCSRPISEPIDVHLYYDPPIRPFRLLDVTPACATQRSDDSAIGDRGNFARHRWYDSLLYKVRRRVNYYLAWPV